MHVPFSVSWGASYGIVASFSVVLVVCYKVLAVDPSCVEAFPLAVAGIPEVEEEEAAD